MKSDDIFIKVGKSMAESGSIALPIVPNKKKVVEDMEEALLDYTYMKLAEVEPIDSIILDLPVLLDRIDAHLKMEEEQEEFYLNYISCLLNVYNNISNHHIFWRIVDPPLEEPRITKGHYVHYLETEEKTPNKEVTLWLYDHMKKKFVDEKSYQKANK